MDAQANDLHRRSEHNSSTSQPSAKRQKIKLACQECRDRKIRCDGARPICRSCSRKKLDSDRCVYSAADTESNESYIIRLERRVNELETRLKNESTTPDQALHAAGENLSGMSTARPKGAFQHPQSARFDVGHYSSPSRSNLSPDHLSPPDTRKSLTSSPGRGPLNFHIASRADSITLSARHAPERTSTGVEELGQDGPQVNCNEAAHSSEEDCPTEDSPAFLGSSSAVGFMSEVYQTFKSGDGRSTNHEAREANLHEEKTPSYAVWFGHSEHEDSHMASVVSDFVVPPRKVADELLNHYWRGAHPLQPFIHQGTFMNQYNELWDVGTTDSYNAHTVGRGKSVQPEQVFHCILNLIFALGCRFRSMSTRTQRLGSDRSHETFVHRATRLLSLDLMDYGSIQVVQALMLMAQYLQTLTLSNKCWVVVGMAIRVAQGIALHLDVAGESQARREERRRTWYACVLLDRVLSMTFGRPLMLELRSTAPLPAMIDDEFLTATANVASGTQPADVPAKSAFFVSIIQLSNITAEVLRLFYFCVPGISTKEVPTMDYASLLRLDAALETWHEELPFYLQYQNLQNSPDTNDVFVRQTHLLHHRYLYVRVLLFRRVVVQIAASTSHECPTPTVSNLQQIMAFSCVDKCTSAAQGLLDLIRHNIGTWLIPPAWYTVFVIYTTGTVFAVVSLTPSFRERLTLEQRQQLHRYWDQCVECLKQYQRLGIPFASKCLWNLQKIYTKEGTGYREIPLNSGTPSRLPSPTGESSDHNVTGGTNPDSLETPRVTMDGQDTDWEGDGWAFNLTNPGPGWPNDDLDWLGDFATSHHQTAEDLQKHSS